MWAAPLLVALAATAWRRCSARYGLATATTAAVFSGRIPLSGPGQPPGPVRLLEGDLYALCGLAVLAGMALALIREQAQTASPPDKAARTLRSLPEYRDEPAAPPAQAGDRPVEHAFPRAMRRRSLPLPAAVGAVLAQVDGRLVTRKWTCPHRTVRRQRHARPDVGQPSDMLGITPFGIFTGLRPYMYR